MTSISFYYFKKVIKLFKFILIAFSFIFILYLWNEIMWEYNLVNENRGYLHLALSILTATIIYPILFLINIVNIIIKVNYLYKKTIPFLFFTFYFLFFTFYFLFFTFIEFGHLIYIIFNLLFILFFFIYILKNRKFIFNYIFAFLTAFSDILIKYTLTNDFISIVTTSNKQFYNLGLYWIPLTFAIVQLTIEAYYFYKKEKPKWDRYKRLKKHTLNM